MKSRFQPRQYHSILSGSDAVQSEARRLPQEPSRTLLGLLAPFEKNSYLESSVFGVSASGVGLIRMVVRDQVLPGNILRIGLFAGLETSGLEVISHLSPYLESTLRRRRNLRAEIRTYPLVYPGAFFPARGNRQPELLPELWSGSYLPDAYYLERELAVYRLNLAITLHRSADHKFHLVSSSKVIRDDLLVPVRQSVLQQFPQVSENFSSPTLQLPSAPKLISESELGSSCLEIALRIPHDSNSRITVKILEELELQYPALLAYQAYI